MSSKGKSFAFCNVKGGCGKTMSIFQLSGCLSAKGYKILCIDADPQHNLSKAFIDNTPDKGLVEVLNNECYFQEVIQQPYPDNEKLKNIYLLPCNYDLFFFENDGNNEKVLTLNRIMKQAEKDNLLDYDFIFIDTNPAINLISTNVLIYTDNIVSIFDSSLDSIEGFEFMEERIIKDIRKNINFDLKIFGVILNNNDRRTNFSMLMFKTITKKYGDTAFDTVISPSIKNKESRAARLPLIEYEPKHASTLQFLDLADEFIKRIGDV